MSELGEAILARAVATIGGEPRPGQQQMVAAIAAAISQQRPLLVQAGTGTGKSLGYLAPVLAHLSANPDQRAVIATATLALQSQLANKDIPNALGAAGEVTGQRLVSAVVKGRSNYACLLRVRQGIGVEQDSLLGAAEVAQAGAGGANAIGAEVVALRQWAEESAESDGEGDRDAAPGHSQPAWMQISVSARECVGPTRCPFAAECFAERARQRARSAQIVVTNHALLAVDALGGASALPEHQIVIVDEAHELTNRVTTAASGELIPPVWARVVRRALGWLSDDLGADLLDSVDQFEAALGSAPAGRIQESQHPVILAVALLRDTARRALSELGGATDDLERVQAAGALRELYETAGTIAALGDHDVVWVSHAERFGASLHHAPLSVAGLVRNQIAADRASVFTSATLQIGGGFEPVAKSLGLGEQGWEGIDVGSPFDYRSQGILYIAKHLPTPDRDGISAPVLAEIAELVWAAGGRTLGLFASRRNAEAAARHIRTELPDLELLCQGERQLSELTRRFVDEPETSLFGTLSLWQGLDVPGETCRLVIIDKIPFPRPDDPLGQARQQAVSQAGGNGFMAVAAHHAGLLLAQGAGRLIRSMEDRGVVAVLDPRLVTARYGSYLRASIPQFWTTVEPETAVTALRRLAGSAT